MQPIPVRDVAKILLQDKRPEQLAGELGVSSATVKRWEAGLSTPRPSAEGRLRALLKAHARESAPAARTLLDSAMGSTLGEIREALHRRGRLSSRGDALDEISKLLFAQVHEVRCGRDGLSALGASRRPAAALRSCVAGAYAEGLPDGLTHELRRSDLELRLAKGEDELARDLCRAFEHLDAATVRNVLRDPITADFLNSFFGAFLADSFADERNMGQYLTPAEVVDVMVTLGFSLLGKTTAGWLTGEPDAGLIVDPSCGVGSFLVTAARRLISLQADAAGGAVTDTWLATLMREKIVGVDKSDRMIRLAITNFALLGVHAAPVHLANALARTGVDGALMSGLQDSVSLILTNPPFGAEFTGPDVNDYNIASRWATSKTSKVDSELLFIERYLDWLREDGVMVAIVPDSVLTNRGLYQDLRHALSSRAAVEAVISLPPATFGVAGTATKTSVLAMRKRRGRSRRAYVALCKEVGFDVETRSSLRQKVRHERNDLVTVEAELGAEDPRFGRRIADLADEPRWDAWFHASLPPAIEQAMRAPSMNIVWVSDVADLVAERTDPRRYDEQVFRYIEISDVDGRHLTVTSKPTPALDAPSRARKLVRAGDVLVSTVRPERRSIGVVSSAEDGAVCSTGFAVLRPRGIHSLVLAGLLRSDFANVQLMRHNVGVSYPAIDEDCILGVLLPMRPGDIAGAEQAGDQMLRARARYEQARQSLDSTIADVIAAATPAA
jgi:transcriptional regulator with XRE-family HTH domain/predicted RNA methylase